MSNIPTITRYTASPTKLDTHPRGTLCVVYKNDEGTEKELFMQMSDTPEDPAWMSAADLVVSCFGPYLNDPQFITNLMELSTRQSLVKSLIQCKNQPDPEALKPQDP